LNVPSPTLTLASLGSAARLGVPASDTVTKADMTRHARFIITSSLGSHRSMQYPGAYCVAPVRSTPLSFGPANWGICVHRVGGQSRDIAGIRQPAVAVQKIPIRQFTGPAYGLVK